MPLSNQDSTSTTSEGLGVDLPLGSSSWVSSDDSIDGFVKADGFFSSVGDLLTAIIDLPLISGLLGNRIGRWAFGVIFGLAVVTELFLVASDVFSCVVSGTG